MYAEFMQGVTLEFKLTVRHSDVSLAAIREKDLELWTAFEELVRRRLGVQPYPPAVCDTLRRHFAGFELTQEMAQRAQRDGVAPVTWALSEDGALTAWAAGPAEAASHVETTLTQAVQELLIAAQVRQLERMERVRLTPGSLLASALARLALGVARLNARVPPGPRMFLFAGRRSSSRRFLVLQNWYCGLHLRGWAGTSALLATATLDGTLRALGSRPERLGVGPLVGTLAHETLMLTDQLLAGYDVQQATGAATEQDGATTTVGAAGQDAAGPQHAQASASHPRCLAQVGCLLGHLLLLASGGGLAAATALPDTQGTPGFVASALAARPPREFLADLEARYPGDWARAPARAAPHPEGTVVFDLFPVWRLDSGSYCDMADVVMTAWEERWRGVEEGARPPRPRFIHSNLEGWESVVELARAPERVRPWAFAFGTLADGFLPFQDATGGEVEVHLGSLVMKAVQARHPGAVGSAAESAAKLGDDSAGGKFEFDTRLPEGTKERILERLGLLSQAHDLEGDAVSQALAQAYSAVTREHLLQ